MIIVAPAKSSHAEAIAALADEMDQFYGVTEAEKRELRIRQINEAIFADQPSAYALLAWEEDQLAGFAAYSFLWPAVGLSRSLFLKELYVAEAARHTGVGTQLMQALFEIALKQRCSRVEWQTEVANEAARAFYAGLGTPEFTGKVLYRVEGEGLLQAANQTRL